MSTFSELLTLFTSLDVSSEKGDPELVVSIYARIAANKSATDEIWVSACNAALDELGIANPFSQSDLIAYLRWAESRKPGSAPAKLPTDWYQPFPAFSQKHSEQRETVIEGIVQRGDVANIIAPSKLGKTYYAYQLALAVASGEKWLGRETMQGPVLIVDNELHPDTITNRIRKVREAMGLPIAVEANIFVASLRGNLVGLDALCKRLEAEQPGRFVLVILDALYRMIPKGSDENANGDVKDIYNMVDKAAAKLGCATVLIHHTSKGDQSRKAVTDVGSGAGAQSRAVDCHLILRPHADEGCVVMQAAIRAFPSMPPVVLKREFPLWVVRPDADPNTLRQLRPTLSLDDFKAWLKPGEYAQSDLVEKLRSEKQLSRQGARQVIESAILSGTLELLPRVNSNHKQMVKVK